MTAEERLTLIRREIEGANDDFQKFESVREIFWNTEPYAYSLKADPESGNGVYFMTKVDSTPDPLGVLAGDIFNRLGSSLDTLCFQLVLANGNTPSEATGYPFFETATEYESLSAGKVRGMSQSAIDVIEATKPYRNGNRDLWYLHKAATFAKTHIPETAIVWTTSTVGPKPTRGIFTFQGLGVPFFTALKVGDELGTFDPTMYEQAKFSFDIAFVQPEIRKLEPIRKTLEQLIQFTDNLVSQFRPLLG